MRILLFRVLYSGPLFSETPKKLRSLDPPRVLKVVDPYSLAERALWQYWLLLKGCYVSCQNGDLQ